MSKNLTQFRWLLYVWADSAFNSHLETNSAIWGQILKCNDDQHLNLTHTTHLDWLQFIRDNPSKLVKLTQFSYDRRLQEFVLTSLYSMKTRWSFSASVLPQLSERSNTWLHKTFGCLALQTSDVCFSFTAQLFSASCCCRRLYGQSDQTSWDTSLPLVILSLHNQWDDGICSGLLTLGSVWTAACTEYTPSHTHRKSPPWIPFPPPSSFRQPHVKQQALLLVHPSSYIYLVQAIPDCHLPDPRPGAIPSPLDSVWTQTVMRPSGVKLLRTLHGPSVVLMKIFNRMGASADLPSCQHTVKSGPPNCSLPPPCCGNDRAGE